MTGSGVAAPTPPPRLIAIGASNLTRGLHALVRTARAMDGPDVEIFAAAGFGRSYGVRSRVGVRTLPGILESGLWAALAARPGRARVLVTDVGNDILYGFSAGQILAWVSETLRRLAGMSRDLVLTTLPLAGIRSLSPFRFLAFRTAFFPSCRLSLPEVTDTAERLDGGLRELATRHGARLMEADPSWYGVDPIHIRWGARGRAWREILGGNPAEGISPSPALEGVRLHLLPPERRWLFGVERRAPQPGVALPAGGRVWLY